MKKLITMILIVAMTLSAVALAADLTETEEKYVGVWMMYATNGNIIYNYSLTFAEDRTAFLHTMRIVGGKTTNDSTTKWVWEGLKDGKIMFSAAGETAIAEINDEGYLETLLLSTKEGMGLYYKCPNMAPIMGW